MAMKVTSRLHQVIKKSSNPKKYTVESFQKDRPILIPECLDTLKHFDLSS